MNVDNPFQSPNVLSICTGMRGLERGLERVIGPLNIIAYVEIEAFIIYNLVRQMEQGVVDAAPVWSNLKTFPAQQFHNKVHGIIGGYPCQPFSTAGNRKGEQDERHLWPYIEFLIDAIRPVWCFFENVDDHITLGFDTVYKSLRRLGYNVEAGIYSAEEAGAPHERQRLFILAMANADHSSIEAGGNPTGWKAITNTCWSSKGTELVNADSQRKGTGFGKIQEADGKISEWDSNADTKQSGATELDHPNNTPAKHKIPARGNTITITSSKLADTWSERGQLQDKWGQPTKQFAGWPTPQGSYQYEWEAPRTIEPGMGCTVNGYNFRNDLLRMYGNGVVEQTAEIAFIDLLKKFTGTK